MDSVINVKINENDEIEYLNIEETEEVYETDDEDGNGDNTVLVPNGEGVMTIRRRDKTIVEHVCGKCEKSYKSLPALKRHLNLCRHQPIPTDKEKQALPTEKRNLKSTKPDEVKANECFCCFEDKETAHSGCIACNFCPKTFKTHIQLERHLFTLHSPCTLFPCFICNATCPSPDILEQHIASHEEGKPFSCQKCGKEFTRKYHLDRHLEYTGCDESRAKKMLPCKVCNKEFTRLDNLREHLRVHLGNPSRRKDYECPYCEKNFYGSSLLNIHIRTHTGERPFPCDLCDNSFPSNGALRKHRRRHTGEKPYTCSECSKCFSVKETLNRHMKIHTGDRPHVCAECGKSFIQATQLRYHMHVHSGESEFTCDICSAQFHKRSRLQTHMRKMHSSNKPTEIDPKKFTCDVCQATFRLKTRLALHLRRHIRVAAIEQRKIDGLTDAPREKRKYTKRIKTEAEAIAKQDRPNPLGFIKIEKEQQPASNEVLNDSVDADMEHLPLKKRRGNEPALDSIPEDESKQIILRNIESMKKKRGRPKKSAAAPMTPAESTPPPPIVVQVPASVSVVDESTSTILIVKQATEAEVQPPKLLNSMVSVSEDRNTAPVRRSDGKVIRCKVCKSEFGKLSLLVAHMKDSHIDFFMNMMVDDTSEPETESPVASSTDPKVPPAVTKNVSPPKPLPAKPSKSPKTITPIKSASPKQRITPNRPLTVTIKSKPSPGNAPVQSEEEEYEVEIVDMKEEPDDEPAPSTTTLTVAAVSDAVENPFDIPISLSASELTDNIAQLLSLLVDEQTLTELGHPEASCEDVLAEVISQCGQTPANRVTCPDYETVMRENAKLLFTSVISNDSIKSLLNNHTVDEVIMHVLKLAS